MLGPFEVTVDGHVVDVGGRQVRTVLALLAANAGRVVGVAALVEQLWGPHAPPDAARTVRTYVSRLRRSVPEGLIVTRPPGYVLLVDPDAVDAARFERLAAAGRQAMRAGQPVVAAETLAAALRLWRGDACGEFEGSSTLRTEGTRLERLRHNAVADRIDAELMAGAAGELVAELEALTAAHPGHERLWGLLMTALYQSGRQSDALTAFRMARRLLIDECGVEPSPELTELHQRILTQDPRLRPRTRSAQLMRPRDSSHEPDRQPAPSRPASPRSIRGAEGVVAIDLRQAPDLVVVVLSGQDLDLPPVQQRAVVQIEARVSAPGTVRTVIVWS